MDKTQWLPRSRQSGLTLFELIFFMVIVSIALAGVLSVMNLTTRHSADPLQRKQALAIAEAILEEVQLLPVAEDACAGLEGAEAAACSAAQSSAAGSKQRDSVEFPFTVVDNYNNLLLTGGTAGEGAVVAIPAGYHVNVAVQTVSLGPESLSLQDAQARLITVTVSYDQKRETLTLQGYRGSYDAPEAS